MLTLKFLTLQLTVPLYVLDDVLYYAVFNRNTEVQHVGAIDAITGKWLWRKSCETDYFLYSRDDSNRIGLNSHIKTMLGKTSDSILMLWHQ